MAHVRPLQAREIPLVVELYRRVFGGEADPQKLADHCRQIYFDHPWYDPDIPSLVYMDGDQLLGFLGVTPRPLVFRDRAIRSAITSAFMVAPEHRGSMGGIKLLKALLAGPQDLSVAEGNEVTRRLWRALGGSISPLQSVHWVCPTRPLAYALRQLPLPGPLAAVAGGLARAGDALVTRVPKSPFRRRAPSVTTEDLTVDGFLHCLDEVSRGYPLRPAYDADSARWLFTFLERKRGLGAMHRTLVRDETGKAVGWHVWFGPHEGLARLVHLGAVRGSLDRVLASAVHDVWRCGATGLTGRMEPQLMSDLPNMIGLISRQHTWTMVASKNADVLKAIWEGEAFFTPLEGEWWVVYHEGVA